VTAVQVLWLLRLLLPADSPAQLPAFGVLVLLELAVPAWAEVARGGPTTYHPHHIAERSRSTTGAGSRRLNAVNVVDSAKRPETLSELSVGANVTA
jgi:hypothetical protein